MGRNAMDLERVRDLERIATLHARGVLDDVEFADAKAQVLARRDAGPAATPARRGHDAWLAPAVLIVGVVMVAVLVAIAVSHDGAERLSVTEYEEATLAAHRTAVSAIAEGRPGRRGLRAAVLDLAEELDGLEPPEQAEAGHEQLVAAYREHVDVIDDLVALVDAATDAAADPSRLDATRTGLAVLGSGRAILAARRDLDAAHDRLAKDGVDVVTLAHPGELVVDLA